MVVDALGVGVLGCRVSAALKAVPLTVDSKPLNPKP